MILGYNTQRPKKSDYENFEIKITEELSKLNIKDLSLMLYGSYVREDYTAGRSDIDAILIFPDNVVINKNNLLMCSKALESALKPRYIPFQISVCDIGTICDGRFNTYSEDFKDYFKKERKIILGPDYYDKMQFLEEKDGILHSASFNLRKSRTGLLFSEYYKNHDYESLIRTFQKGIDTALNSTKQITYLNSKNLVANKFSSFEFIRKEYPNVDLSHLSHIQYLYQFPHKPDDLYKNPKEMINLWANSLETFEEILREYIKQNPQNEIPTLTEVISN